MSLNRILDGLIAVTLGSRVCCFSFVFVVMFGCLGNIFISPGKGKLCEHVLFDSSAERSSTDRVVKQNHIVYKYKRRIIKVFVVDYNLFWTIFVSVAQRCRYFYNLWAWMEGIKNWNVLLNSNSQRQHKIDEEFFEVREWRNENIKVRVAAVQGTTKTNGWEVRGESMALRIPTWGV